MPGASALSKEDKMRFAEIFAEECRDVRKWLSLEELCRHIGKENFGRTYSYESLRYWYDNDPDIMAIAQQGLTARAEVYMKMSQECLDKIEDFYNPEEGKNKKVERMQAVNKAKLFLEHYATRAAHMAPHLYGDFSHELREVQRQLKTINERLEKQGRR